MRRWVFRAVCAAASAAAAAGVVIPSYRHDTPPPHPPPRAARNCRLLTVRALEQTTPIVRDVIANQWLPSLGLTLADVRFARPQLGPASTWDRLEIDLLAKVPYQGHYQFPVVAVVVQRDGCGPWYLVAWSVTGSGLPTAPVVPPRPALAG